MGDRANVVIKRDDEQVCLYTHCNGSELLETVRNAMILGREFWKCESYLARIIFCQMVANDELGIYGFGISQTLGDGRDRVLILDVEHQTVKINDKPEMSFEEYVSRQYFWK